MSFSAKLLGVSCASVIALGIGSASAADMYRASGGGLKDAPIVAPPAVWTGFYAGVNGGGSFGDSENLRITGLRGTEADIGQFYRDGGFGGGQIGYNWSGFGGNQVVFGIETDIQGSSIGSSFNRNDLQYGGRAADFNASQNIDYFGTVRGRLGYGFGSAMIYATGGFAYANVDTKVSLNVGNGSITNSMNSNQLETGWVVGGGLEYLFAPNWSAKVEYQYIDLSNCSVGTTASDGHVDHMPFDNTFNTVRAGINYHMPVAYTPLK